MIKVLFIQNLFYESLGIRCLSAALKAAGHRAELAMCKTPQQALEAVQRRTPDLVALSLCSGIHNWYIQTGRLISERTKVPVIYGGPHATFFPEMIERHRFVELIVRGEGDETIVELADALDQGAGLGSTSVRNTWVRRPDGSVERFELRPFQDDLDKYPLPDRRIYEEAHPFFRNEEVQHIICSRGCPRSCLYCYNSSIRRIYGLPNFFRLRSPENVLAEVKLIMAQDSGNLRLLNFVDDNPFHDRGWAESFLEQYARRFRFPFVALAWVDVLLTPGFAALLKQAGCVAIKFGVEQGNEEYRRSMLNRPYSNEQLLQAARNLHEQGISVITLSMIGLPQETRDLAWETILINHRMRPQQTMYSIFQPYPRTEISHICRDRKLIDADYSIDEIDSSFSRFSVLKSAEQAWFSNLQKFASIATRWPGLRPLIDRLCGFHANFVFEMLFLAVFGWEFVRAHRLRLRYYLRMGIANWHYYFKSSMAANYAAADERTRP